MTDQPSMASLQEADYGADRNYAHGSPHLAHAGLRDSIASTLRAIVDDMIARHGHCRVVEIGAGHGTFTAVLRESGALVTVTEMSEPSARRLKASFVDDEGVRVVHDPEADQAEALVAQGCELLVFISVLHHIPDYCGFVERLVTHLSPGGAFYSTQDPIWYADRTKASLRCSRGAYLSWRLAQGDLLRGFATRARRARGVLDETNPADMVEYHVVRSGVNQDALATMLGRLFTDVRLSRYWSTQSAWWQRIGDARGWESDFGLVAKGRTGTDGAGGVKTHVPFNRA